MGKKNKKKQTVNTQSYYDGPESIYKLAEMFKLNSYEFDILKRVIRCRKKGVFINDLTKTKDTIDIYIKEQGCKYKINTRKGKTKNGTFIKE